MKRQHGFTLLESVIGLSLSAVAISGIMTYQTESSEQDFVQIFINQSYDIVKAVDHRIAVDGYDPALWTKTSWANESEIVSDLIKKQLTSQHLTGCSGGEWNPILNSEHKNKLIACNQWAERKNNGEIMKAAIKLDSAGFIQGFNLDISYANNSDFEERFLKLKKAMLKKEVEINQELTGSHYIDFASQSTNSELTSTQCLNNISDCTIRFSIDRNGGNEYLRADGGNSMIGEHLTFIEAKGQAPMKCLRWKKDNSGNWNSESDEECGIGVYKELNHPAVVDVVVENGTFQNVLLNKDCNVFESDGANGIQKQMNGTSEIKSPCGLLEESGEIIQVVDNIHASEILSETASFNVANVDTLIADSFSTKTLEVANLAEFNNVRIDGELNVNGVATFNKETTFKENVNITKDLLLDNGYASTSMKAPIGEFDNINLKINDIQSQIKDLTSSVTSSWETSSWGSCSAVCGGGTQHRTISCPTNKICTGALPSTSRSCNTHSCPVDDHDDGCGKWRRCGDD